MGLETKLRPEVPVRVDHDQPDRIWFPMTWSVLATTLRRQVDRLMIESDEAGLIIAFVEADPHGPPHSTTTLIQANCVARVAVSPDHLLALIKRLQKAYLAQLARKIRSIQSFRS
jgi:hypothetical protein